MLIISGCRCIRGLRDVPHPNIIAFYTFIITPSYALITMAHHPRCRRSFTCPSFGQEVSLTKSPLAAGIPVALPEEKAAGYFRQLISAVDYLHAHGELSNALQTTERALTVNLTLTGYSHNDIKPANILLSEEDSPILIDFGFAQHYGALG